MNKLLDKPPGIDAFDRERCAFLVALAEFLADPLIPRDVKRFEVAGTQSAVRNLSFLAEVED